MLATRNETKLVPRPPTTTRGATCRCSMRWIKNLTTLIAKLFGSSAVSTDSVRWPTATMTQQFPEMVPWKRTEQVNTNTLERLRKMLEKLQTCRRWRRQILVTLANCTTGYVTEGGAIHAPPEKSGPNTSLNTLDYVLSNTKCALVGSSWQSRMTWWRSCRGATRSH